MASGFDVVVSDLKMGGSGRPGRYDDEPDRVGHPDDHILVATTAAEAMKLERWCDRRRSSSRRDATRWRANRPSFPQQLDYLPTSANIQLGIVAAGVRRAGVVKKVAENSTVLIRGETSTGRADRARYPIAAGGATSSRSIARRVENLPSRNCSATKGAGADRQRIGCLNRPTAALTKSAHESSTQAKICACCRSTVRLAARTIRVDVADQPPARPVGDGGGGPREDLYYRERGLSKRRRCGAQGRHLPLATFHPPLQQRAEEAPRRLDSEAEAAGATTGPPCGAEKRHRRGGAAGGNVDTVERSPPGRFPCRRVVTDRSVVKIPDRHRAEDRAWIIPALKMANCAEGRSCCRSPRVMNYKTLNIGVEAKGLATPKQGAHGA